MVGLYSARCLSTALLVLCIHTASSSAKAYSSSGSNSATGYGPSNFRGSSEEYSRYGNIYPSGPYVAGGPSVGINVYGGYPAYIGPNGGRAPSFPAPGPIRRRPIKGGRIYQEPYPAENFYPNPPIGKPFPEFGYQPYPAPRGDHYSNRNGGQYPAPGPYSQPDSYSGGPYPSEGYPQPPVAPKPDTYPTKPYSQHPSGPKPAPYSPADQYPHPVEGYPPVGPKSVLPYPPVKPYPNPPVDHKPVHPYPNPNTGYPSGPYNNQGFPGKHIQGPRPTYPVPSKPLLPSSLCDNCKFKNGVGFNPFPNSCNSYVTCQKYDGYKLLPTKMHCPYNLFWNQKLLTCVRPKNFHCPYDACLAGKGSKTAAVHGNCASYHVCDGYGRTAAIYCCAYGYRYQTSYGYTKPGYQPCVRDPSCSDSCAPKKTLIKKERCRLRPVRGYITQYQELVHGKYIIRHCAPGTAFVHKDCGCTARVKVHRKVGCKAEVFIDFKYGIRDVSGNFVSVGNEWDRVKSVKSSGSRDGFAGQFYNGQLILWRFANAPLGPPLKLSFVFLENAYKKGGYGGKNEVLVSNGDCGKPASVSVTFDRSSQTVTALVDTKYAKNYKPAHVSVPYQPGQYKEVVYSYDGKYLTLSVNGRSKSVAAHGDVQVRQCALSLGGVKGGTAFYGLLDDFKLFLCAPKPVAPYPAKPHQSLPGTYPAGPGPYPGGPGPYPAGKEVYPAGPGPYPVGKGVYPAGPGPYPAGRDVYPAGPSPYPTGKDDYPAGPGPYPAGKDVYPAGPGPYPAGKDVYPAGPGPYPAGKDVYPAGPGPYPAGNDVYPAGPGPYPAGKDVYPAGPGPYPAGKDVYPAGPGPYPAGKDVYPAGPGPYPAGKDVFPAGPGPYPAGKDVYPAGPGPYPAGKDVYPAPYPTGKDVYPVGPGPYPAGKDDYPAGPGPYPAGKDVYPAGPGPYPAGKDTYPVGPGPYPAGNGPYPAGPVYPAGKQAVPY